MLKAQRGTRSLPMPARRAGSPHLNRMQASLALPKPLPCHTKNTRRRSPVEGLDYGGPAVIEPRPLRPETLRHHLSVGLPFANPKALSDVFIGRVNMYHTSTGNGV